MIELEFCFEINSGDDLFILRQSKWQAHRRCTAEVGKADCDFGHVGRRLDCEDEKCTFLTPGFFPRLQVHLHNAIEVMEYDLKKDLIKIVDDSIEVLIEFNEAPTSFIDIMVRFSRSKPLDHVLEFLRETIIRNIRLLQRNSGCWQGVLLIEKGLRPSSVEKLMSPKITLKQSVSLEELSSVVHRSDLVDDIVNITYARCSMEAIGVREEYTPIIELIGESCFREIVLKRLEKVKELGKQLGIDMGRAFPGASDSSSGHTEANCDMRECSELQGDIGVDAGLDSRLQRMEANLSNKIEALTMEIKGLRVAIGKLTDGIIPEVHRLLTELRNINSMHDRGGNSSLPLFFLLDREKTLLSRLVPGLEHSRLTFMCESSPMPHPLLDQEGIAVSTLGEGVVSRILPYLHFMLQVFPLGFEVGAPIAKAKGITVPNLSKLIDDLIRKSRGISERSELFPGDECNAYNAGKNVGLNEVVLAKARVWVHAREGV